MTDPEVPFAFTSLSASNAAPRPREWERVAEGRVRAVGENHSRTEKAEVRCRNPHQTAFLNDLAPEAREILDLLLKKYATDGELQFVAVRKHLPDVLKLPPISQRGNVAEIAQRFGGFEQLGNAVNQLQTLLYAA